MIIERPHKRAMRARQSLNKKDFTTKVEDIARKRKGKREYLNDKETRELLKELYVFFDMTVDVPRIKVGKKQGIQTLINEEALRARAVSAR